MAQTTSSQHPSRTSRPQLDTRDGFAAIDFGSTSTRAYLATVNKKTKRTDGYRVQKIGVDDYKIKRFLRGEWPSKGCPFDDPYPVGYDATSTEHADKRDRSLKSFVWFLADDDDQHPYTRDLKAYYDLIPGPQKAEFRERLTNMLVTHLTIVAGQIFHEAMLRETTIRRLVFCVPNVWAKSHFQNILRPVMDEVAGGVEAYCVFESEALAQFILQQHPYLLTNYEFVLVCDFGGHFMGGSLFQFCKDGDGDEHPSFFSLPQGNFGTRGGSQLWEDHIRPYIDAHLATLRLPADKESVLRAKFLDAFFISKAEVESSFYAKNLPMRLSVDIKDLFPDDKVDLYHFYLKPADILQAWQLGFRAAIDLALKNIGSLRKSSRGRTVVILSGGSMLNSQARSEIQQACKGYGIECKIMGLDINPESGKWMVCEGAAMAEASAMSPREFFKRGAALAIQPQTRKGDYEHNAKVLFRGGRQAPTYSQGSRSSAQLGHLKNDRGSPIEIELREGAHDNIRLVCDPLYQRHCHQYPRDCITIHSDDAATAVNNCYDVWDISRHFEATLGDGTHHIMRIRPGRYLLEAEGIDYHTNGVDATLNLRMTRQAIARAAPAGARKNLRARTMSTRQDGYTLEVPLTACGSSNLVSLDLDRIKDRQWKPQQMRIELPLPLPESAGEARPTGKRKRTVAPSVEEPYYVEWGVAQGELSANSHQQGSEGGGGDSYGTPSPNMSFNVPGRPPSMAGTPVRTVSSHGPKDRPRLDDRKYLAVKRPKGKTHVHLPKVNNGYGTAESDSESDSDSDSSDIPDNPVNFLDGLFQ